MGPIHRNFCDVVSALLRDIEQFDVEAIAVDGGDAKEVCCHSLTEQFESALCVGDSSEASFLDECVEQVAQNGPIPASLDCIVRQPGGE